MAIAIKAQEHNVGGVLLDRPFKVRRLGHFGYNNVAMEESLRAGEPYLGPWG